MLNRVVNPVSSVNNSAGMKRNFCTIIKKLRALYQAEASHGSTLFAYSGVRDIERQAVIKRQVSGPRVPLISFLFALFFFISGQVVRFA
jgi:hypothetical protein